MKSKYRSWTVLLTDGPACYCDAGFLSFLCIPEEDVRMKTRSTNDNISMSFDEDGNQINLGHTGGGPPNSDRSDGEYLDNWSKWMAEVFDVLDKHVCRHFPRGYESCPGCRNLFKIQEHIMRLEHPEDWGDE